MTPNPPRRAHTLHRGGGAAGDPSASMRETKRGRPRRVESQQHRARACDHVGGSRGGRGVTIAYPREQSRGLGPSDDRYRHEHSCDAIRGAGSLCPTIWIVWARPAARLRSPRSKRARTALGTPALLCACSPGLRYCNATAGQVAVDYCFRGERSSEPAGGPAAGSRGSASCAPAWRSTAQARRSRASSARDERGRSR
jgi:hypothetical protein